MGTREILDDLLEEQTERRDPVLVDAERNWERHPELRADFGGNFDRYVTWLQYNVRTG